MNKYDGISEEELKNKIAVDYFSEFDCTKREDNIDFWVMSKDTPLLWAESKKGKNNITDAFIQLVLTIGKHQTNTRYTTPAWLAAFDATCISFIPYLSVMDIFGENDFNWNVTPSNHKSKEFIKLKELIESNINTTQAKFDYKNDSKELRKFIKKNISEGIIGSKVKITRSSFVSVFFKWMEIVKPTIDVTWDDFRREGILPRDFYLADLLSRDGVGLIDNLSVLLNKDKYKLRLERELSGQHLFSEYTFNDNQKAYNEFWNKYERPPKKEYWEYIIKRVDLLVPQDIRERKGSYFTPQIWVRKSQEYLAEYLGDDWQDKYYIWDCCAGTGNMEIGLYNKYKVWASTIDSSDVSIMRERIKNGASLLEDHVFKFDFLNGSFSKLPENLRKIIDDPEERKKLIVYINPPYAEAANKETVVGTGENKTNVAVKTDVYQKYSNDIGIAGRELFAQFLIRIYKEIPDVYIANFSKLKNLQGPNFKNFRNSFLAKLERLFIVPANTFDNVKGEFPIGFFIWNTQVKEKFTGIISDVYNSKGIPLGSKSITETPDKTITDWLIATRNRSNEKKIAYMSIKGADFQNINYNFIINDKNLLPHPRGTWITDKNIVECSIAFAVRHCIEATWLNDRDQFLYPNDGWKADKEFQTDCLVFTLFHNSNNIKSADGINHWIPFYEEDVDARDMFDSHFMADFISGKIKNETDSDTLIKDVDEFVFDGSLSFSDVANDILNDGKVLWEYYQKQPKINVNASLYEIKEHFQGRDANGKMNKTSQDAHYNDLMNNLKVDMKLMTEKIASKVYQYGFLMR